jgi:hypothetical protein
MFTGSPEVSKKRKMKELMVLDLHRQGYSSRQIAKEAHVSLREVTKYIQAFSNKRKSPSTTSIHDEIVLEYRVNLLRSEARDLEIQIDNLKDELEDLRARKYNALHQLRVKQSELDVVQRDLEYERFSKDIGDIFTEGR